MKRYLLGIFLIFGMLPLRAQFTKATLKATGLTCAMCSKAINKALEKVSSVASVRADIKNSAFDIVFKPEAGIDIDALKDAVEDAGFAVGGLRLTGTFQGIKISSDQHVAIGDKQFCFLNVSEQTLNGEQTITVVDKNFLTAKEFKKISGATKMNCLQTGKAGPCCGMEGASANARVYHVTI